jgi:ABC-type transporter Mla MlaB component
MLCTLPLSRFSKATDNGQPGHICVDLGQLAKLDSAAVLQCLISLTLDAWKGMHGMTEHEGIILTYLVHANLY